MCQAPVGKVIKVDNGKLIIEYKGKNRELRSKLMDVCVNDYVLFSVDIAIDKIDQEEALAILEDME